MSVAYRDQEEGYAEDSYPVRAETIIFAAVAADKTRTLDGKPVKVVRFTIDTSGWYWIPRNQFLDSTERFDVNGSVPNIMNRLRWAALEKVPNRWSKELFCIITMMRWSMGNWGRRSRA